MRKGILLAGGTGARLLPTTRAVSKQLIPIYDKPMVYYPLSTLLLAGIREILIVTTRDDQGSFERLLGNGRSWGVELNYAVQGHPSGIADVFRIARDFVRESSIALILGDNFFYGHGFGQLLQRISASSIGATIFGHHVQDPSHYGILGFDRDGNVNSIEEKPSKPQSSFAIPGLYFYDSSVHEIAANLIPSSRGELEISEVNQEYLKKSQLKVEILGRDFSWFDTGTPQSLLEASQFVSTLEHRQGRKIGCPEEIAFHMKYISKGQLIKLSNNFRNDYGDYLRKVANSF